MDPYFFLRFSLQRMGGVLDDDWFDSCDKIKITKEEIESFILECHKKQQLTAEKLIKKYGEKMTVLEGKKVLFVGDSLTTDRLGYRGIITKAARLNSKNVSYSGATSVDMYRYLYGHIIDFEPEIISVMIGTNDAMGHCGKNRESIVSKDEYRRNIRGILESSKQSGARVLITTIPQLDEEAFLQTSDVRIMKNDDKNIAEYNKIVRKEAIAAGVELIDLESTLKEISKRGIYEPDGIHLSTEGQEILADLWLEKALY